jgi:hypothetical protein
MDRERGHDGMKRFVRKRKMLRDAEGSSAVTFLFAAS